MKVENSPAAAVPAKKTEATPKVKKDSKKESLAKANTEAAARTKELKDSKAAKAALEVEKAKSEKPLIDPGAVEVSINARPPTEEEKANQKGYTPQEVRAKAKAFLQSGNLPPEQREVLDAVIKKEENAEKAAIKKRIKEAKG